ncbi:uncharacterized protein LOC131068563 isoform X2 [Cryptomeria japonica]|uniref:uncharacterized protein LOC131068563 isoform X2 n=1 Tax=Cryptomeria japonica TaxID=3369 RepID=UPI0027DA2EBC|nr:uncharacterized protein LOC131068563 isoform X2 [Cryptomeria japonica]
MAYSVYTPSCIGRRMFAGIQQTSVSLSHHPPPPPREVHFWYLHPEEVQDRTLIDAYKGLLSSEEYAQISQLEGKQIKKQALLARVLVRTTLAKYTDGKVNPKLLMFSKNMFGKPELVWPCDISYGNEWKLPPLCFNIAHTSSLICCGVTTKSSVGIDVEEKTRRTNTNILAFAKRWFSSPEIAWLDAFTDPEEQRQKFIQLWTLKEAYVKALGKGISGAPLKDFSIHIKHLPVVNKQIEESEDAGSDSVVSKIDLEVSKKSGAMRTNWQFLLFQPTNLHYASVCIGQDENHLHEDEMSQMSSCCYLKVHAWKTVPLVKDESQSVKETIIASTNARSF